MLGKILHIALIAMLLLTFLNIKGTAEKENNENKWWEHWSSDKNHNGIDDLIDEKMNSNEEIPIFIDYAMHPTKKDVKRLKNLGIEISYVCKYIDTICAENVEISKILEIKKLPNVVMIEEQSKIYPMLDVSARAVKARESDEYTPNTAWELGYTGKGVNIAIIDTGVDDDHESLRGKFVAGVDFTDNSPWAARDGSANPDDRNGHGTHCAGIAMGTGGNEGKYKGIALGAKLIDVKVLTDIGRGVQSYLVEGIEWCIEHKDDDWGDSDSSNDGIDVLSISIGGYNSDDDGTRADSRAANKAVEHGLIVVAAIGNDGNDHQGISSPAAADNVIAVGAIDDQNTIDRADDVIADYSNSGPRDDDGDDDHIDELKPEIVAPGSNIYSADYAIIGQQGIGYVEKTGTSMSTPHISGVAALMLEANPNLEPLQLKEIIKETAEQRGEPYDVNLSKRYNQLYGWGIVDAYKAVLSAKSGEIASEITCKINYPKEGENVSGIIEISGTASSTSSIDRIEVKIDSKDWDVALGTDTWVYYWTTTNETNGNHTIYARAISGNNEALDSINVFVNNLAQPKNKKEWYKFKENLALISVFILSGFALIFYRKKH